MTGQTISHYEIVEEPATVKSGLLFKARERVLGQIVAIKILNPELGLDQDAVDKFSRDARAASALNHRNVATILEIGRGPSGTALSDTRVFVVSPFLRDAVVGDLQEMTGGSPERAVEIAHGVAEALSAAHELGLVHGALTPDSISVSDAGNAVVNDFGLSRLYEALDEHPGDEAFRAPEQRAGNRATRATDLWSLGALLYAMISGGPPVSEPGRKGRKDRKPNLLAGVSSELVDLVDHLLDPDPDNRPSSARAAASALQDVPESADAHARSVFVIPQSRSWSRMLLGTILVMLIGTAVWFAVRPSAVPIERRVLAIAPFEVESDTGLEFLATGSADVLSVTFDSLGGWRTIGSDAVVGWAAAHSGLNERDRAIGIADRFGAERVVTGSIRHVDETDVIIATVYGRDGLISGKVVVDVGSGEELPDALDDLVRSIASELEIESDVAVSDGISSSHVALKSYLEGTEAVRKGALTEAVADFRSAVAADPDFALAWSGLARAARLSENHRLADRALEEAQERNDRLPPTARTLVRAHDLAFR
ncbi:MAG: protein kinase, partial [Rhodothermia bacterium]